MTQPRRQLILGALGAAIVTLLCVAAAARTGAVEDAFDALGRAPAFAVAGVFGLMVAVSALRYLRLQLAIPGASPLETFNAAALHASAAAVIPGKLGELVLPVVVRRLTGSSFLAGAGLLVIFRLLDLAALLAVVAVAGILAGGAPVILAPVAAAALTAPFLLQKLAPLAAGRLDGRLAAILANISEIVGGLTRARLAAILTVTIAVWAALWWAALAAARGAGLDAPAAVAGLALAAASA
ncbi:MAG: flippase-like domain-containing protein, partial [Parvularculaceae bacterium]|nr:flippase-like domain-containing protein [Parvularculaceae bacterium]